MAVYQQTNKQTNKQDYRISPTPNTPPDPRPNTPTHNSTPRSRCYTHTLLRTRPTAAVPPQTHRAGSRPTSDRNYPARHTAVARPYPRTQAAGVQEPQAAVRIRRHPSCDASAARGECRGHCGLMKSDVDPRRRRRRRLPQNPRTAVSSPRCPRPCWRWTACAITSRAGPAGADAGAGTSAGRS